MNTDTISSSVRRRRDRFLAAAIAVAVILSALKLATDWVVLLAVALLGAVMLTTAFSTNAAPRSNASMWSKAVYLLTFGLVDVMAALDELARLPRI